MSEESLVSKNTRRRQIGRRFRASGNCPTRMPRCESGAGPRSRNRSCEARETPVTVVVLLRIGVAPLRFAGCVRYALGLRLERTGGSAATNRRFPRSRGSLDAETPLPPSARMNASRSCRLHMDEPVPPRRPTGESLPCRYALGSPFVLPNHNRPKRRALSDTRRRARRRRPPRAEAREWPSRRRSSSTRRTENDAHRIAPRRRRWPAHHVHPGAHAKVDA
jgi:hypothetical protein